MIESTPREILNQMREESLEICMLCVYGVIAHKIKDITNRIPDSYGDIMTIDRESFSNFTEEEMDTKYEMSISQKFKKQFNVNVISELDSDDYPETDAEDLIFSFHCDSSDEANYVEEQLYKKFQSSTSNILVLTSGGGSKLASCHIGWNP